MAASGKSTFAKTNAFYSGYRIVDYAVHLPAKRRWTVFLLYMTRPIPALRRSLARIMNVVTMRQSDYFASVLELMRTTEGPVAVLGRRLPDNFRQDKSFEGIKFGMVLIPEERHRRNVQSRRHQMRNPLPLMHHWSTDFRRVSAMRQSMSAFAEQYGIPVFESFELAIDTLGAGDS